MYELELHLFQIFCDHTHSELLRGTCFNLMAELAAAYQCFPSEYTISIYRLGKSPIKTISGGGFGDVYKHSVPPGWIVGDRIFAMPGSLFAVKAPRADTLENHRKVCFEILLQGDEWMDL